MIDDRLVLATALTHTLQGAVLSVEDPFGGTVTVGRHPSSDVDPCRWRATVADARATGRVSMLAELTVTGLGGAVRRTESGMFAEHHDPLRRWTAVMLAPCVAADVMRSLTLGDIAEDSVTATIRPDPELGVTVIGVGVDETWMEDALEELAGDLAAALAVAELTHTLPVADL